MKPIRQITKRLFKTKTHTQIEQAFGPAGDLWQDVGGTIYNDWKHGDFENAYPSITKIMQNFATIEPFAIGTDGKKIEPHPVTDVIYNPNQSMSAYDFREALMLMYLVHDETYIRVHYKGTKGTNGINVNNITGFTFIENITPTLINNVKSFYLKDGTKIAQDEVMTIYSANPYDLTMGYSATRAGRRWARIDDYISDYQAGFFRNGAVPAGQFIITAASKDDFLDIKRVMQAKHRGAGKNENVVYSWKPVDPNDGTPLNSQIEWVPFSTQNRDMALKDLFANVNQKVDSNYGVPAEIRGFLQNSNYASVAVAERVFVNYTLRPLSLKVWDKFTHELVRITGGFDAAITFELKTPLVADELKVRAEAQLTESQLITQLQGVGYKLDKIVDAFGLNPMYKELGTATPPKRIDEPQVVEDGDQQNTPEQDNNALLKDAKKLLSKRPKLPFKLEPKSKQLTPTERDKFEKELELAIKGRMNIQVERVLDVLPERITKATKALKSKAAIDGFDDEDDELLAADMMAVLIPLVYIHGKFSMASGMSLLLQHGLDTSAVGAFKLTAGQQKQYQRYLSRVARSYNADTALAIRQTLENGITGGLTRAEIEQGLRAIALDDYRSRRLAVSEVNRAQNHAGLFSMENISEQTGFEIVKISRTTSGDPCPMCEELDGTEVGVAESFLPKGDSIIGTDGKTYENNFVDADTADYHPFCQCIIEYEVRE